MEEFPREIRRIPEVKPEEEGEAERERETERADVHRERGEREGIDNVPFYFWGNDLALKGAEIRFAGRGGGGTLAKLAFVSFRNWRSGQEKEKRGRGRWWEKERGRLLRRRNSKAGTYASFIKEIASKDCCFAHGYVSGAGSAGSLHQPRPLLSTQPSSLLCRCRCSRHSNYAAFIFNLFLEITICPELAQDDAAGIASSLFPRASRRLTQSPSSPFLPPHFHRGPKFSLLHATLSRHSFRELFRERVIQIRTELKFFQINKTRSRTKILSFQPETERLKRKIERSPSVQIEANRRRTRRRGDERGLLTGNLGRFARHQKNREIYTCIYILGLCVYTRINIIKRGSGGHLSEHSDPATLA